MNEHKYGALVEYYWQGRTKALGEKPIPVPFHPPQIPHELPFKPRNAWEVYNKVLLYDTQRTQFTVLWPIWQSSSLQFSTYCTEHPPCLQGLCSWTPPWTVKPRSVNLKLHENMVLGVSKSMKHEKQHYHSWLITMYISVLVLVFTPMMHLTNIYRINITETEETEDIIKKGVVFDCYAFWEQKVTEVTGS